MWRSACTLGHQQDPGGRAGHWPADGLERRPRTPATAVALPGLTLAPGVKATAGFRPPLPQVGVIHWWSTQTIRNCTVLLTNVHKIV